MQSAGVEPMKPTMISRTFLTAVLLLTIMHVAAIGSSLRISHVSTEPAVFKPGVNDGIHITYRLSAKAKTLIKIFDSRDLLVRRVPSKGMQPAGDHQAIWDGKDEAGQPVPPNYYTFVVEARTEDGESVVYDLTDLTGGAIPGNSPGHLQFGARKNQLCFARPCPGEYQDRSSGRWAIARYGGRLGGTSRWAQL